MTKLLWNIIVSIVILTSALKPCLGFSYLSYSDLPKHHFGVATKIDRLHVSDEGKKDIFRAKLGLGMKLENITYVLDLYPMPEGSMLTAHNFYWDAIAFELPVLKTGWEIQVGLLNLGVPHMDLDNLEKTKQFNDVEDTAGTKKVIEAFRLSKNYYDKIKEKMGLSNSYFKHMVLTHRAQFFKDTPVFVYYSMFNTLEDKKTFRSSYAISYETEKRKAYIEHDPKLKSFLLGLEVFISDHMAIETVLNPMYDQKKTDFSQSEEALFETKFAIGIKIINPLTPKKELLKDKARFPKQIDEITLMHMEKGLIAYYDEDYETALKHYLVVVKRDEYFVLGHIRLGDIYFQLDMLEKSKQTWQRALVLDPGNAKAIAGLEKLDDQKREKGLAELDKISAVQ